MGASLWICAIRRRVFSLIGQRICYRARLAGCPLIFSLLDVSLSVKAGNELAAGISLFARRLGMHVFKLSPPVGRGTSFWRVVLTGSTKRRDRFLESNRHDYDIMSYPLGRRSGSLRGESRCSLCNDRLFMVACALRHELSGQATLHSAQSLRELVRREAEKKREKYGG